MCCKKWVGGLAALAVALLGLGLIGGTEAGRVVSGWAWVQVLKAWEAGQKQMTPEDEIRRIGNEVTALTTDIDAQYDKVVQVQKDIERSEKEVAAHKKRLDAQWVIIQRLRNDLDKAKEDGKEFVVYEGKKCDFPAVRADLTDRWTAFKTGREQLARMEKLVDEKRGLLASLNDNMKTLVATQDELKLKIAELQNKLEQARVKEAQAGSSEVGDGYKSRLAHIQDSLTKVETRIDTMSEVAKKHAFVSATHRVPVDQTVKTENALDEIRQFEEASKLTSDK